MTIGHLTSLALCIPCVHLLRCPVLNNDLGLPSGVGQDPPFLPGTIEGLSFPGTVRRHLHTPVRAYDRTEDLSVVITIMTTT